MKLKDRVMAGMAYLDAVYGRSWRKKIRRKLDLSDNESCPLGQTDDSYVEHQKKLGLSDRASYDLGFHILPGSTYNADTNYEANKHKWSRLTRAWKKALND